MSNHTFLHYAMCMLGLLLNQRVMYSSFSRYFANHPNFLWSIRSYFRNLCIWYAIVGRQWTYQTCTEFGFYQTSDSTKQPFGNLFPLKLVEKLNLPNFLNFFATIFFFLSRVSIKQCMDIFGPAFNETENMSGVTSTNTNYGGMKIAGTKVNIIEALWRYLLNEFGVCGYKLSGNTMSGNLGGKILYFP